MILFIYGEDTYRSHQKLMAMKNRYIDKSLGDTNISVADLADKEYDITQITNMILAVPFLAKTRLVIIKSFLTKGNKKLQQQIIELLDKVPETTILLFYEDDKIDRRTVLFKKLKKIAKSQEFKKLEEYQLFQWVKNEVEKQGGKIEAAAIHKLILYVGNDLWRMANEIEKVISYQLSVISENIELLVKPQINANIFALIDSLGQKNKNKALAELDKLLTAGQPELYVLTMIVYQFRNLLIVKDLLETANRKHQTANLAREAGLHPFVAEKTSQQAINFTLEQLKEIYQILLDYDLKIKDGTLEPKLALQMLIVELSK